MKEYLENIIIKIFDFFFSIQFKNSISPYSKTRTALIISINKIGDTTFTLPAVNKIIKHYNKVFIICTEESKDIYEHFFENIKIITLDLKKDFYLSRIPKFTLLKKIYGINSESIYDLTGNIRSYFFVKYFKNEMVYGTYEEKFTKNNNLIPNRTKPHLIDRYIEVVKQNKNINFTDDDRNFIKETNDNIIEYDILIHPFAGWTAKEWGIDKFIQLYNELTTEFSCAFIFEEDKKHLLQTGNIILTKNIKETINHISRCKYFISNDSGPLYIAAALGKKTFTIYGPTNPNYSLPLGDNHNYIQNNVPCIPLNTQYCATDAGRKNCNNFICMNTLEYKIVKEKIIGFLGKNF